MTKELSEDIRQSPKIKICGLTRLCDIDYINEAAPEYIGFVFAKSKRQIEAAEALMLRKRMRENIIPVGVFVNAEKEQVVNILKSGTIDVIQLHGNETAFYAEEIKKSTNGCVIKAVRIGEEQHSYDFFRDYINAGVDYFLFDSSKRAASKEDIIYGGTGMTFDWSRIPKTPLGYFLAGGLDSENIVNAMIDTQAFAFDISSGVETDGVKDKDKILDIIRRIRNV